MDTPINSLDSNTNIVPLFPFGDKFMTLTQEEFNEERRARENKMKEPHIATLTQKELFEIHFLNQHQSITLTQEEFNKAFESYNVMRPHLTTLTLKDFKKHKGNLVHNIES